MRVSRTAAVCTASLLTCLVMSGACGRPARQGNAEESVGASHAPVVDSTSVEAAVDVVRGYYAAIDAGDYRTAYRSWGGDGASSGQSYDQFVAGFAHTRRVTAELGAPGRLDAAAGSRFVEVPVTIRAETDRGEKQRFTGSLVVRRAEVDGATEAQRRWHLYSASVKRVPE